MAVEPGLIGQIRQKLVDSKRKRAAEGRRLTGAPGHDRLPPGQRLVTEWPVLDLGVTPTVGLSDWRLTVDGAVDNPVTWDWAAFLGEPQSRFTSDIHCVTAWSLYDNPWEGVAARHLLSVVRPRAEAKYLVCHGYDGYTTNLPLAAFDDGDVLLAWRWRGEPIPRAHGGPVRVVVPKLYFWKSAKWVKRIEFVAWDAPGFWEARGYHNIGDPWREERYG